MVDIRKSLDNAPEEVNGAMVVIGDLHTSPRYQGTHKDYAMSSIRVLSLVKDILVAKKEEFGRVSLMLLGDTFGVNERNFNNEFYLTQVGVWYRRFNDLCDGHVYSVRGNHDMGEYTTFDYAKDAGWVKNPEYVDMVDPQTGARISRMHIVNYGHEHDTLNILKSGSNVVFGHNDYSIPGITPTYGGKEGDSRRGDKVVLSQLDNFLGVDLVISGHIHTPLMRNDLRATMSDGSSIDLLIPGSPSRVSERIESCYDVVFSVASGRVDYNSERIQLWPVAEEFIENPLTEEQQGIIEDMQEKGANLSEILSTVMEGRLAERFSNIDQIYKIPGFTDKQRKLAEKYYRKYSAV